MTYGNGGSIVVEDFYIAVEKPLPFDVRVTVNQDVIEYDDREDPPIYNTYTVSESVTLNAGSTTSEHNKLDSGTSGVDQLGSFWTYIVINGKTYDPFKNTITYTYNGITYIRIIYLIQKKGFFLSLRKSLSYIQHLFYSSHI